MNGVCKNQVLMSNTVMVAKKLISTAVRLRRRKIRVWSVRSDNDYEPKKHGKEQVRGLDVACL